MFFLWCLDREFATLGVSVMLADCIYMYIDVCVGVHLYASVSVYGHIDVYVFVVYVVYVVYIYMLFICACICIYVYTYAYVYLYARVMLIPGAVNWGSASARLHHSMKHAIPLAPCPKSPGAHIVDT